ncbi:MAG: hypothetical protein II949_07840 [Prevotella sp.]|nr:hypothetical protein [Prevotella sp.]
MEGITPHEILLNMFTHFPTTSSRTSAIVIVGVKRILFSPQDIEQKISTFNEQFIQMKEYSTLSSVCRILTHHLKTALNSIYLRILGRLKVNLVLNNINYVKNEIFENYFEQISHFSTV